uniref:Uncharacterized protein n=1 Tax=Caenorhabditis japonica TaxID=281687 RepID=A0A8R1DF55_CAEJA
MLRSRHVATCARDDPVTCVETCQYVKCLVVDSQQHRDWTDQLAQTEKVGLDLEQMDGDVPNFHEELLLGPDGEVVFGEDGWSILSWKKAPLFVEVLVKKKRSRKARSGEDVLREEASWADQLEMDADEQRMVARVASWSMSELGSPMETLWMRMAEEEKVCADCQRWRCWKSR